MFKLISNVFNKKKKPQKQKLKHQQQQQQLQQQQLQQFQMIDERTMHSIECEYELKQKSIYQPPKQEEKIQEKIIELLEYEVKEDDSLFGVALKFNINLDYLMHLNELSSELIWTGMILKIPSTNLPRFSVQQNKNEVPKSENLNIWNQEKEGCLKFQFYYCNSKGNVGGRLTITQDVIFFDPDSKCTSVRYNTCISMQDINEAVYYVIPNQLGQKDYLVQILLSGIGKQEFETKYQKKLKKYKEMKRSIATVFFRHQERDEDGKIYTEEKKKENCILISQYVTNISFNYQAHQKTLTKIPFIDLIDESWGLQKTQKNEDTEEIIGERMGKLWASLDYVPVLQEKSNCLNESMYKQLIEVIPPVFRLAKWYIRFQIDEDGASYRYMLMELKYQSPFIIIIQDLEGEVFGAYVSTELKVNYKGFWGNGETFLFNYNKKNEITRYQWTEKNEDFTFCDQSGLGVGCGDKFGIFIDQSMEFGYSNPCDTFDNPRFSKTEKFKIKHIEVWTIQLQ